MTSKKKLKCASVGVGLCLLVLLFGIILGAFSSQPEPMPNPNGYDDLLKAGSLLWAIPPSTNLGEVKNFLGTNQEAMKLARTGLERKCRNRIALENNPERWLHEAECIKTVVNAFAGQAKIALSASHPNEAVDCYLDSMAVAIKSAEGGYAFSRFEEADFEAIGRQGINQTMSKVAPQMAAPLCRKICQKLNDLDSEEESGKAVAARTRKYLVKTMPWFKLACLWNSIPFLNSNAKEVIGFCETNRLARRQIMLAFAARAYELDHGKPPPNAAALVPEYLKKIPQDPATGTNLVLQATASSQSH